MVQTKASVEATPQSVASDIIAAMADPVAIDGRNTDRGLKNVGLPPDS
jgi:hypothetical protein